MENLLIKRNALRGKAISNPFTLVELLVVVSIIAVIGAGVALTYQNLDDHAKTAMEMADMSALKKCVKHWSAVNDYNVPEEFDSLIDDEGNLYTMMGPYGGSSTPSSSGMGLMGPAGYTLEAHEAPDVVLNNLAGAGMDFTYLHLVASDNANDSTFEKGMMGATVDTTNTKATMVVGDSEARDDAGDVVADGAGALHDYDGPDDIEGNGDDIDYNFTTTAGTLFGPYAVLADWVSEQTTQQGIIDAITTDALAFVYPGGGAQLMGAPHAMNLTDEIITNAGLTPDQVADPSVVPSGAQKYYLVVMGFGRFCSIHKGKAIRSDAPITGKRDTPSDSYYSRYLAVFRVPIAASGHGSSSSELTVLVDVLSPYGYSVAALRDSFINDKEKIQD